MTTNNGHLALVKTPEDMIEVAELPDIMQNALAKVEEMDSYCLAKGKLGGLDWGFQSFNDGFEGLQTGVYLIGGQSNIGKSALCLQLAWQVAKNNQVITEEKPHKAYVLYFSLDDNAKDLMPRLISMEEGIEINVVRNPSKYADRADLTAKRSRGVDTLRRMITSFRMLDSTEGNTIEFIEQEIDRHRVELSQFDDNYKLVVFIDNFYDIGVSGINFGDNSKARAEHVAKELNNLCDKHDIPIVCTAEFRKLNGIRRPTLDDIKDAGKVVYAAKAIILCYQEVHLRGEAANIFWSDATKPEKQPVLECHFAKNKFNSYKGRVFFNFIPSRSTMVEVPREAGNRYRALIT